MEDTRVTSFISGLGGNPLLHATIMAGGAGTRFWPASRMDQPKQLLSMTGGPTMIQATVNRLKGLCSADQIRILTNQRLVEKVVEQLPELGSEQVVGEPCKRDTAPCIGLAAAMVEAVDPEGTMIVLPSDHVIGTDQQFQDAVRHAVQLVDESPDRIVTFGIKPDYPATVFGYIERGEALGVSSDAPPSFVVKRFREKPDGDTARNFLDAGSFYWNSGIFVWKAATILNALREYEPEMAAHIDTIKQSIGTAEFQSCLESEFHAIKPNSIDFAVMERYQPVCVVEAPFEWNDVGNWTSLEKLLGQDPDANTLVGRQLTLDSKNCIVRNETDDGHLVATIGMHDCIVIRTPDATLIVNKQSEADVKKLVAELEGRGWNEYL